MELIVDCGKVCLPGEFVLHHHFHSYANRVFFLWGRSSAIEMIPGPDQSEHGICSGE
jgi:hypothetical protein